MSARLEWRVIYGKPTLFADGIEIGDCYQSAGAKEGDVWRIRFWNPDRPDVRRLRYVKPPEGEEAQAFAQRALAAMVAEALRSGVEA